MNAPPVISEHVEHAQDQHQERRRPLCFEPDGNHPASTQPDDRHQHPPDAPLPLDDESQKEEDEQYATGEQEAANQSKNPLEILIPL